MKKVSLSDKTAQRQREKFDAIPPPPPRLILSTPVHLISFGFGSGLAKHAPGTWGTLAAVPLYLVLSALTWPYYAAVCLLLFGFGCWATGESARLLHVSDYPGFVFDEIVGFLIAAAPLVVAYHYLALVSLAWLPLAFGLFRLFDILKPWPIGWLDRRVHGGLGVMLDDGLAGLASAAVLYVAMRFAGVLFP
jgi:phosphatidylglycerophosphatase A